MAAYYQKLKIHLDNLWHRGKSACHPRKEIRLIQACQTQLILDTQLKPFMKTGIIFVSLNQVAAYDADILCLRTYLIGCCKKLIYSVIETRLPDQPPRKIAPASSFVRAFSFTAQLRMRSSNTDSSFIR